MKRLLFCLMGMLLHFAATAQQKQITEPDYSFYEGEWAYCNDITKEEFTVVLKIFSDYIAGEGPFNCLVGAYKYTKNNQVIIDCLPLLNTAKTKDEMPIFVLYDPSPNNPNELAMSVEDYNHHKYSGISFLITLSKNPKQIQWELIEETGDIFIDPNKPKPIDGFSIPVNAVLTQKGMSK